MANNKPLPTVSTPYSWKLVVVPSINTMFPEATIAELEIILKALSINEQNNLLLPALEIEALIADLRQPGESLLGCITRLSNSYRGLTKANYIHLEQRCEDLRVELAAQDEQLERALNALLAIHLDEDVTCMNTDDVDTPKCGSCVACTAAKTVAALKYKLEIIEQIKKEPQSSNERQQECDVRDKKIRELENALYIACCALEDIGDADREPGDDLEWCEQRAKQALPIVRNCSDSLEAARKRIVNKTGPQPWFCEHANEVPQMCPCKPDCYCKSHTCKNKAPQPSQCLGKCDPCGRPCALKSSNHSFAHDCGYDLCFPPDKSNSDNTNLSLVKTVLETLANIAHDMSVSQHDDAIAKSWNSFERNLRNLCKNGIFI